MTSTPGAERPDPFTVGLGAADRDPDVYGPTAGLDVDPENPRPSAQHVGEPRDTVYGGPRVDRDTGGPAGDLDPDDLEDTPLDELRRDLAEAVLPTTTLPVPGRPGWEAVYRVDIRSAQIDGWRKRAKKGRRVDGTLFAALALAETNTELRRAGRPIRLDGEPATFRHAGYLETLAVTRSVDAVVKTYGLEGHVDAAARALLAEAGWGDEVEPTEDPTQ